MIIKNSFLEQRISMAQLHKRVSTLWAQIEKKDIARASKKDTPEIAKYDNE